MKDLRVPGYEDKTPEKINMGEVVGYLNDALIFYGPPCDWCAHFDCMCEKNFRPRQYSLRFGPIESWIIRKNCKEFKPQEENDNNDEIERQLRNRLDCGAQQYGG